jgi:transposase-like protein
MRYQKRSSEFKLEAVRLAEQEGMSVAQVARDLGISESVLYGWVKKFGARPGVASVTPEEREELIRLRRELRIVKEERDILKKATAFFARQSQ